MGHTILIRPGEELQYYLETAGNAICHVRLEYTQDGGLIWNIERDNTSTIDHTGTAGTPLTGTIVLGWVKNETQNNKLYRWNMVSFDAASADVDAHLSNHDPVRIHLYDETWIIVSPVLPVSGTAGNGAHFAGPGSQYHCIVSPSGIYYNDGNSTLPIWKKM